MISVLIVILNIIILKRDNDYHHLVLYYVTLPSVYCASSTSCMDTILSSSPIIPLLTRRSSCMWPPTPNNKPICTHSVRTYVPASQLIQNTAKFLSLSYSIRFEEYIVLILSCLFTALINGGRWNNAPVSFSSARETATLPPGTLIVLSLVVQLKSKDNKIDWCLRQCVMFTFKYKAVKNHI